MIKTLSVVLIVAATLGLVLYFRGKFGKGLHSEQSRLDNQPADNLVEYNGGVCFIDADGCIGTVVSRKKRSNLPDESGYYIPEFLRR